jgi:predicted RNA-binding protein YlqC (UPF0109 family)
MKSVRKTAEYLLGILIEEDKKIKFEETPIDETSFRLTATVPKEAMGKIIGKEGKTIRAIRNLLILTASRQNLKIIFSVTEPTE